MSTTGPPGELITSDDRETLEGKLKSHGQANVDLWVERIIGAKRTAVESTLRRHLYPDERKAKFLPPGSTQEELNKYAKCDVGLSESLGFLYAALNRHDEQAVCLVLGH